MGLRQREWAARAYATIIERLGGKCVDCGATKELQLDHIKPCEWEKDHCRYEWSWRISKYRQDEKDGKLTVRCLPCNASKSDKQAFTPVSLGATNGHEKNGALTGLEHERQALKRGNELAEAKRAGFEKAAVIEEDPF